MTTLFQNLWHSLTGQNRPKAMEAPRPTASRPHPPTTLTLDIAPNDPLSMYFQSSPGAVEIERLRVESPTLAALKAANAKLVLPLVNQGELIGLVNLGPRQSEQDYSSEDRSLLNTLSTQAAPAVRVAQLVRQQKLEVLARERIEQQLRVARLIQQTLLPQTLPDLPGWAVATHYQPAQAVGGDFYDFVYLPDGRVGFIIGDVTDKGVPAALVMATTRAILRGAAGRNDSPGEVLQRANDLLYPDIPAKMFVTCLYAILDPATGHLRYANAGHDMPYIWSENGVEEMRARGMPLGLMPDMLYEEKEKFLAPGESVLLYSDGLVEAHNPQREMFGFPRLGQLLGQHPGGASIIPLLLEQLASFTGPHWEQEDDTTMVVLQRGSTPLSPKGTVGDRAGGEVWRTVTTFSVSSEPGNEREAMNRVAEAAQDLSLPPARLEKLKTAVAEATMNAIEHGNHNRPELPVEITVLVSEGGIGGGAALAVRIADQGGQVVPASVAPDLDAKLAGQQSARGWGLFLIEKMVDKLNIHQDAQHHTLELIMNLGQGATV